MNKNIVLIGKYPPPFGGITVHIQRLYKYLEDNNFTCYICHTGFRTNNYDVKNLISIFNIIGILKLKRLNPIIHFHISEFGNLLKILGLTLFFKSQIKIITIHSGSFAKNFEKYSILRKNIIFNILRRLEKIIAVNSDQKNILIKYLKLPNDSVDVIPAFLTPDASEVGIEKSKLIKIKNSKELKIVTSGYIYDYYGFDMLVNYFIEQKKILGIFAFYDKYDPSLKSKLLDKIHGHDNIMYFVDLTPSQFNWLLKNSDIYIRNTDRDGDCVAIREAVFWGTKVCASKSVKRPRGVELFSYNDIDELNSAINKVLSHKIKISADINNGQSIMDIYNKY